MPAFSNNLSIEDINLQKLFHTFSGISTACTIYSAGRAIVKIPIVSDRKKCEKETEYITINNKIVRRLPEKPRDTGAGSEQEVFIIGSKGIPALYGGFETFVEKLTENRKNEKLRYHVARMANDRIRYEYNGVECFDVKVQDRWVPVRIEMDEEWYLVGLPNIRLDGLLVRM